MPEEEIHHQPEQGDKKTIAKPAKKNHTLLIVMICVVVGILLLSIGGYLGYINRLNKKNIQNTSTSDKPSPDKIDGKVRPGSNPDTTERQASPAYF